jgi:hypothetical protein
VNAGAPNCQVQRTAAELAATGSLSMTPTLRYPTGEDLHLGDRVNADGMTGTVVCVIESGEYSDEFSEEQWSYLERGFMFRSDDGILIHFDFADACTSLISRGA